MWHERRSLLENEVPYFCWDRAITVSEIRRQLAEQSGVDWLNTAAWIMREAAFEDVWQFLSPREVSAHLDEIEPFLGRRRDFWKYIIREWHELGKL